MSRDFRSKTGQRSNASGMWNFEAKRNQRAPKDVKLHVLQNWYLGFLTFLGFDPKKIKVSIFQK